jgi:hypothetical protein
MKILENIVFVLCVCSLCSKAVIHSWRHFHPAPVTVIGL